MFSSFRALFFLAAAAMPFFGSAAAAKPLWSYGRWRSWVGSETTFCCAANCPKASGW